MNKFHYQTEKDFLDEVEKLKIDIPFTNDLTPLVKTVAIGSKTAPNSFAVLPMEGCDSNMDGSPSDLTLRRYQRFAHGGAGLLWCEANAVVQEGRANEHQMMLTKENLADFQSMTNEIRKTAKQTNGYEPILILQLTHSGRYSRPIGHKSAPLVPQHDPILDPRTGVTEQSIVSDDYLDSLIPKYVQSARLAKQAGFDGVDIKSCHRYLLSELLASFTRPGKYGTSFENRTRLILSIIKEVRLALGKDFIIASRFNVFDAHPYPYGFGVNKEDFWKFDPTEPERLVKAMLEEGVNLLSNSAGNPYYIYPQVTRPFDVSSMGIPTPEEHQLVSIERLFKFSNFVYEAAGKKIPVIGNGYSWLRQFIPNVGAANLAKNSISMVGLGRESFAYPDAPRDILQNGKMDSSKVCISCSQCTQIMRDHGMTGCVIRDRELYAPMAKKYRAEAAEREAALK